MVITEIFKSIQGESTYAGLPCVFVPLTGCNLRCTWCDTTYAFCGGAKMSVEEVLDRVAALSMAPQTGSQQGNGEGRRQASAGAGRPKIPRKPRFGGQAWRRNQKRWCC